jgi:DNA-binding protein HU-beta
MTETELKRALAMKTGLTSAQVTHVLDELANVVVATLDADEAVILPHIGKLSAKVRPARQGRNPKTGEALEIPEKRVAVFTLAKWLRERVAL